MSDQSNIDFEAAWALTQLPPTGRRAQAQRLAGAMRRVIDHLLQVAAPEEDLAAAADAHERYAKRLSKYPISRSYEGFAESANAGDPHAFFDHSPLIGIANPLALPVRLAVLREKVEGRDLRRPVRRAARARARRLSRCRIRRSARDGAVADRKSRHDGDAYDSLSAADAAADGAGVRGMGRSRRRAKNLHARDSVGKRNPDGGSRRAVRRSGPGALRCDGGGGG